MLIRKMMIVSMICSCTPTMFVLTSVTFSSNNAKDLGISFSGKDRCNTKFAIA